MILLIGGLLAASPGLVWALLLSNLLGLVVLYVKPLGRYMADVMSGRPVLPVRLDGGIERFFANTLRHLVAAPGGPNAVACERLEEQPSPRGRYVIRARRRTSRECEAAAARRT